MILTLLLPLLLNPVLRVWNLRLLLLSTIVIIVLWIVGLDGFLTDPLVIGVIIGCCLLFLHHCVLGVILWQLKWLALVDFVLVLVEIAALICFTVILLPNSYPELQQFHGIYAIIPALVSLILSSFFRATTIGTASEPIMNQEFVFLGGCTPTHPPYTPLNILLNRSISRPLVRGESRIIILLRALSLSIIARSVPTFATYLVFITPTRTQVYTRTIQLPGPWELLSEDASLGNATVFLAGSQANTAGIDVRVLVATLHDDIVCLGTPPPCKSPCFIDCPVGWNVIDSVSISVSFPYARESTARRIYVIPVRGNLSLAQRDWVINYVDTGVLVIPGSHVYGSVSWTRRDILNTQKIRWGISSWMSVYIGEVSGLQTVPENGSDSDIGTLTLLQRSNTVTKVLQETVDTTTITGVATFGGFWTFLNGAFALLFGANVLYFMFGRRPLSALGVVHMFQRGRLVRQWHEDFPAIHTEGGLPGSKSAGIVAFIRERLVDLGDDPPESEDRQADVEAQSFKFEQETETHVTSTVTTSMVRTRDPSRIFPTSEYRKEPGHRVDEMPLLDIRNVKLGRRPGQK